MKKIIVFITSVLAGAFVGFSIASAPNDKYMLILILSIIISFIFATFIHEFGHFVCGKLSGYKFISFRLFNLFIYKDKDNKLNIKFTKKPGRILGQCLLYYPNEDNNQPYKLYNYGGVIFNILSAIILIIISILIKNQLISHVLLMISIINIFMYFNNGIDFDKNIINDKKNINTLNKNPLGIKYFNQQLSLIKSLNDNIQYKDLNFDFETQNILNIYEIPFSYSNYLFYYFSLLENKKLEEAEKLLGNIYSNYTKLTDPVKLTIYMLYFSHLVLISKKYDIARNIYLTLDKKHKNIYLLRNSIINTLYNISFSILSKRHISYINTSIKIFKKQLDKEPYNSDKIIYNYYLELINNEINTNNFLYEFKNLKYKLVFVNITKPIGYLENNITYNINFGNAINYKNEECYIIDNNINQPINNYIGYLIAQIRNKRNSKIKWIISNELLSKEEILNKISTIEDKVIITKK